MDRVLKINLLGNVVDKGSKKYLLNIWKYEINAQLLHYH